MARPACRRTNSERITMYSPSIIRSGVVFSFLAVVSACVLDGGSNQPDQQASDEELLTSKDSGQTGSPTAAPDETSEAVAGASFSGGGCTGAFPISSCISGSGNNVRSDFYMNAALDSTRYWYVLEVTRTNRGSWWAPRSLRIDHTGHYSAVLVPINTLPVTHGCATTVVHVYTKDFVPHGVFQSPSTCY
jgi:hypothetical protein